jgi:hypothetical protein
MNLKEAKILAAYFTRAGNNYVSGKIVNLPVGNTRGLQMGGSCQMYA